MRTRDNGDLEAGSTLATLDSWLCRVEGLLNRLGGWVIFAIMLIVVAEVVGRRMLNVSIQGTIDVVQLLMAAFAFLGLAYCQREGAHVRMDIVLARARDRLLWSVEAFGVLLALVFVAIMTLKSYEHFLRAWEIGDSTMDLRWPVWPSKMLVPIGLFLLAVRLALQLSAYLRLARRPQEASVSVPVIRDVAARASDEIQAALGDRERSETSTDRRE